jgi:cell division ATPase FtsA
MTRLHVFAGPVPRSLTATVGGMHVTDAIARELDIDVGAAEQRKRILGLAGSQSGALTSCAEALCDLLREARLDASPAIRVAMIGNGARLPGLLEALSERCRITIELPVPTLLRASTIGDDVLRCASPDWTLAAALMTWRAA